MVQPNWNFFKSKFNDNPRDNFEWFCYLLFCKKFNKPYGIFRYRNQTAIETDPIEQDNEIIGWQAKFYETTLSDHRKELTDTIVNAKKTYPNITKLIFYTNQEWGQGRKKRKTSTDKQNNDPVTKQKIEKLAKSLNIELIWNTKSFFESPFVCEENSKYSSYFFKDNSTTASILKLQEHTENILFPINTSIFFQKKEIHISREDVLKDIENNLISNQIILIHGEGGVGKTAVVKKLYEKYQKDTPFLIFKASEFNINNINKLFTGFDINDFIKFYGEYKTKIIVIDSAEKIMDIKNTDPLKEFLSSTIKDDWKIIFTTRDNFLDDLQFQFITIYNIKYIPCNIKNCDLDELKNLSTKFNFDLPKDEKFVNLIKNPFYFKEYLSAYLENGDYDYLTFKNNLWKKCITKGSVKREQSFLGLVKKRVETGVFFIQATDNLEILDDLVSDGILGREDSGYFITHDIYEEWALEFFIKTTYQNRILDIEFFNNIGNSLAIRRSFRNWISEKLLLDDENIKSFIECVIDDIGIESFWKDEILISILLSDYSEAFFKNFSADLLRDEFKLLKKMTFLLRLACKESDDSFFSQYKIEDRNLSSIKYIFNKPKGKGWDSFIKFIYENIEKLDYKIIAFILPVLYEYVSKYKKGITTKYASSIALNHYKLAKSKDCYYGYDDNNDKLYQTIVDGSSEIIEELKIFFNEILENDDKEDVDELSKYVLTKMDGAILAQNLPKEVIKLADFYWFKDIKEDEYYGDSIGIEEYYSTIDRHKFKYSPASAYQTPIYGLLRINFIGTLDFIIEFTNKTVEYYCKSKYGSSVEKVELVIDGNNYIQYNSAGLWQTYRGVGSSTPELLQSIHMALEKYLLEIAENYDKEFLKTILKYILMKSKSSSLSAVVSSIVIANHEKLFEIAKILFRIKKFFKSDLSRMVMESSARDIYSFGDRLDTNTKLYEYERQKTCEEKHRNKDLENIFLNYQFFRTKETSKEESSRRQKVLWEILDEYYTKLPNKRDEKEKDKIWRIALSRMDKRKMSPTTEKQDNGFTIDFNPKIDDDLKEYMESSQKENTSSLKYTTLYLWSHQKFENNNDYKKYTEFEDNYKLALEKVKEYLSLTQKEKNKYLGYDSIPSYICAVLLRDSLDELSNEYKIYCKDIILDFVKIQFQNNYRYQILDGVKASIYSLPILYEEFLEDKKQIKLFLFMSLFGDHSVSYYAIDTIHKNVSIFTSKDLESFVFGYLLLNPKFTNEIYDYSNDSKTKIDDFIVKYEDAIKNIMINKISIADIPNIDDIRLDVLNTTLELIIINTKNELFKNLTISILDRFSKEIFNEEQNIDYIIKTKFLKTLAILLLTTDEKDIKKYLEPFLDSFNGYEVFSDFFHEIILAQDRLDCYDNFWYIWKLFQDKIILLCKDGDEYRYINKIVREYLFAGVPWSENIKHWHTIKSDNKKFFRSTILEIGHCPSAFYAISKLLNDIGLIYLKDGISWLSQIIDTNDMLDNKLETNTIYYLEINIRIFIFKYKEDIRKQAKIKSEVLVILNFLILKQSCIAYRLREDIY